jgi:hypothetical protein
MIIQYLIKNSNPEFLRHLTDFTQFHPHALRRPQASPALGKQKGELAEARLFDTSCGTQLLAPLSEIR